MKKFSFPLDTVLNYKDQVLDSLKGEHARIMEKVNEQAARLRDLEQKYKAAAEDLRENTKKGMTISSMREYEGYLVFLQKKIVKETEALNQLKKKEEKKRSEVVEARKEKVSIEKLKEKKQLLYNKDVQKDEEKFIEEFVANTRVARGAG